MGSGFCQLQHKDRGKKMQSLLYYWNSFSTPWVPRFFLTLHYLQSTNISRLCSTAVVSVMGCGRPRTVRGFLDWMVKLEKLFSPTEPSIRGTTQAPACLGHQTGKENHRLSFMDALSIFVCIAVVLLMVWLKRLNQHPRKEVTSLLDGQNLLYSRRPANTFLNQATERELVNRYDLKHKFDIYGDTLVRFLVECQMRRLIPRSYLFLKCKATLAG